MIATRSGFVRVGLCGLLGTLLLCRREHMPGVLAGRPWVTAFFAGAGVSLIVLGLAMHCHTVSWLGLLLLYLLALEWALPGRAPRDLLVSLLLLAMVHPLPPAVHYALIGAMQRAAILGSQWLMHVLDVRVWADGTLLRTGEHVYEVPPAAGGAMAAGVAVVLGLGLTALYRGRWVQCVLLTFTGLVEALILNVCALSATVGLIREGGDHFRAVLDKSPAVVTLGAALLVSLNMGLWLHRRRRRRERREEVVAGVSALPFRQPHFWHVMVTWGWGVPAAAALVVLGAGLVHRSRPAWRVPIVKDVAVQLRKAGHLEAAQRAADAVRKQVPADEIWALEVARLLALRGRYERALSVLSPAGTQLGSHSVERNVLRAYSLYALGRLPEAFRALEHLPPLLRASDPRVPMMMARLAFLADEPDQVAENVLVAAREGANVTWMRSLYPYLRQHRKWRAIADSHAKGTPLGDPAEAFAAIEACMNLDRAPDVAELTRGAAKTWPEDPRLLEPLFYMTCRYGATEWEDTFSRHISATVPHINAPEELLRLVRQCFQLQRPDLAWLVHRRLHELDPEHPVLWMNGARYGFCWFVFRTESLVLSPVVPGETLDLRPFFIVGLAVKRWHRALAMVPMGRQLCAADTRDVRKRYLERALTEFAHRDERDRLSLEMQYEYVGALDVADRLDEARERLRRIALGHDEERCKCRLALSEMYERRTDWQNVYEALRGYSSLPEPGLSGMLRLCRAELGLGLGLAAVHTARATVQRFPASTRAVSMLARTLLVHDTSEEALFALQRLDAIRDPEFDTLEADALIRTQRYNEIPGFLWAARGGSPLGPGEERQDYLLAPAEATLEWSASSLPSEEDFTRHANALQSRLADTVSPFLRRLSRLWLDAFRHGCTERRADPAPWLDIGRTSAEEAVALNQLALLLCREDKLVDARNIAGRAVKLFPQSPLLWRLLIKLSAVDEEVIKAARRSCPDDPEIWLAELVLRTRPPEQRTGAGAAWVLEQVKLAVANRSFSPDTMARAGDYLLRIGMMEPAVLAARDASSRGRGLLPICLLALKCSLVQADKDWALESAKQAIAASVHPHPYFYTKIVELKSQGGVIETDEDMLEALKKLRNEDPKNPMWARLLGVVRFRRGSLEVVDAVSQMKAALDAGSTDRTAYLVGAEAARFLDNFRQASDFLREGRRQHPQDLAMLNNLAYTLSSFPEGAAEAQQLLPELLGPAESNLHVLDTITAIYVRSGQLSLAEKSLYKILSRAEKQSAAWFRAMMQLAQVNLGRGNALRAQMILDEALQDPRQAPEEDIRAARALLERAESEIHPPRPSIEPDTNAQGIVVSPDDSRQPLRGTREATP